MKQSVANEGDRQTMYGGEHKIIQFMSDGQERVLWRTIDFSGILNCLSLRSGLNRGQKGELMAMASIPSFRCASDELQD